MSLSSRGGDIGKAEGESMPGTSSICQHSPPAFPDEAAETVPGVTNSVAADRSGVITAPSHGPDQGGPTASWFNW